MFFLDYYATGKLDVDTAAAVITGIAEGCRQSGCALVGGETAEMPGMYHGEYYDDAGFCVGVVEKADIIDGSKVQAGDTLLALASSGSPFQPLLAGAQNFVLQPGRPRTDAGRGQIAVGSSAGADAYGLTRATAAGIEAKSLNPADFADRGAFDLALSALIDHYRPEAIVLAGYMRILSTPFVARYTGRMLNVHPSLLPRYPGLHTHRQALANGDAEHGTSVHFVTDELDGGPVGSTGADAGFCRRR